ncbi:MAG: M23 family metallopeptidase [Clostridiales bacterium]|jgi:murein DD-endopeptidase MepM/ murein hydrolase activator NlpD|nr:M23 family metallopeptidase [Clostridiales bacterium]
MEYKRIFFVFYMTAVFFALSCAFFAPFFGYAPPSFALKSSDIETPNGIETRGIEASVSAKPREPAVSQDASADFEGGFGGEGDGRLDAIMQREEENIKNLQKKDGGGEDGAPPEKKKFIKWCEFNPPYEALSRAMSLDINSRVKGGAELDWTELLALLAVKYYGNFSAYKAGDLDKIAAGLRAGGSPEITRLESNKYYAFYREVYGAVLGEYLGYYEVKKPSDGGGSEYETVKKYGMRVFSPIAAGYGFSHYDDFGNSRSFGYKRRHLGHDLMGGVGTPIIVVEGGTVTEIGWNRFGGWRIGIRSRDSKRYYYYAHMRKDKPYARDFKKGDAVESGDVIGYLGMTGYSSKENVNNIKPPHLHFGLQLIFDESQVKGPSEIWVDVYALTKLLQKNKSKVVYDKDLGQYVRKPE